MINNKFLVIFLIFFLGCQNEDFDIPTEIELMDLGELYEELKWEVYSQTYDCIASPLEFNFRKREEIEVYKIDVAFANYNIINDTLNINYKYTYDDRIFIPKCQDAPFSFLYILSTKERIGWNTNGMEIRLDSIYRESLKEKEKKIQFLKFIQSDQKDVNDWIIYYAKKKNYLRS